jgi:hypothetical protein
MTAKPPALVELHDARVRDLAVLPGGIVRIAFSHIVVYEKAESSDKRYRLWAREALLELSGVEQLELSGSIVDEDDYVSDMEVFHGETAVPWVQVLEGVESSQVQAVFGSGASLTVRCSKAVLTVSSGGSVLEEWEGPLS